MIRKSKTRSIFDLLKNLPLLTHLTSQFVTLLHQFLSLKRPQTTIHTPSSSPSSPTPYDSLNFSHDFPLKTLISAISFYLSLHSHSPTGFLHSHSSTSFPHSSVFSFNFPFWAVSAALSDFSPVFFDGVSLFLQGIIGRIDFSFFFFFFLFFFCREIKGWNICPSINQGPIRTKATLSIANPGDPVTLIHREALQALTLSPAVPEAPRLLRRSLLIVGNDLGFRFGCFRFVIFFFSQLLMFFLLFVLVCRDFYALISLVFYMCVLCFGYCLVLRRLIMFKEGNLEEAFLL